MANDRIYMRCTNPDCDNKSEACILRNTAGWWEATRAPMELDKWLEHHNECFPHWQLFSEGEEFVWKAKDVPYAD